MLDLCLGFVKKEMAERIQLRIQGFDTMLYCMKQFAWALLPAIALLALWEGGKALARRR